MVFPGTALLQQQAVPAGQEYRDGLVPNAGEVRLQLGDGVGRTSVINADDQVGQAIFEWRPCRIWKRIHSMTRLLRLDAGSAIAGSRPPRRMELPSWVWVWSTAMPSSQSLSC